MTIPEKKKRLQIGTTEGHICYWLFSLERKWLTFLAHSGTYKPVINLFIFFLYHLPFRLFGDMIPRYTVRTKNILVVYKHDCVDPGKRLSRDELFPGTKKAK